MLVGVMRGFMRDSSYFIFLKVGLAWLVGWFLSFFSLVLRVWVRGGRGKDPVGCFMIMHAGDGVGLGYAMHCDERKACEGFGMFGMEMGWVRLMLLTILGCKCLDLTRTTLNQTIHQRIYFLKSKLR